MGLLVDGKWTDRWYDTRITGGRFVRQESRFRNWITLDGSPGPTGEGGFKAEPGRYHLYVSLACPWAHRTLIFRALKHLENAISLSVVLGLWAKRAGRSMRTPALFRIRSLGRAVCMRSISALTRPTLGGFVLDLWPPSTRSNSGGPPN